MKHILKKLKNKRWMLRSIFSSIYFNFHYLPLKQAVKLPIVLYKPKLLKCKGKIKIEGKVKTAMIQLGKYNVSLYPNSGIVYENHGGTVVFKGECLIGNNSFVSIGEGGMAIFGDKFTASTTFRLTSYDRIEFEDRVLCGWDILIMDTDFHKLTKLSGGYNRGHAPIHIGSNNWFGNGCKILKRTMTPNYCIVSAGTILTGPVNVPEYSVIGNPHEMVVKATGIWRNINDDRIEY